MTTTKTKVKWLTKGDINNYVTNILDFGVSEFPKMYERDFYVNELIPSIVHKYNDDFVSVYLGNCKSIKSYGFIGVDNDRVAYIAKDENGKGRKNLADLNNEELEDVWMALTFDWGIYD